MNRKNLSMGTKKALFLMSGIVLGLPSCTDSPANFSGTITGVDSDTLLVFIDDMKTQEPIRKDTVPLSQNHFEMQLPETASYIRFMPKPKSANAPVRMMSGSPIMFFPGDKLFVQGSVGSYQVSGSELYDAMAEHDELIKLNQQVDALNDAFMKAYKEHQREMMDSIKGALNAVNERVKDVKFEIIKAAPNSMASAFYATSLKPEQGMEAIGMLADEVKNGPMAPVLEKAVKHYTRRITSEKAKENMVPGKPAPDFKMKTLDGKEVTLATFKGKHLLVDFWGTWCGWCIKGIPDMKKYYAKYHEQIEFLGVCCRDSEKKWRAGVAEHGLPWVNVLEGDSNLSAYYAVPGFPTKVLIGPDGKIIEIFVGESADLYNKLDELFGK